MVSLCRLEFIIHMGVGIRVTTAGCKRQAWHSRVRSSSIQRDERDAPRSAQEPQQLETIDVVWHEDQIYVAGTFNRRFSIRADLA